MIGIGTGLVGALSIAAPARAQPPGEVRLSGYVRSSASGEVVRHAQITVEGSTVRTESNQDGFYVLGLARGPVAIVVRAIGYEPRKLRLTLAGSESRDFVLEPKPFELEELTVRTERDSSDIDPGGTEMSVARVEVRTVKLVPAVLGELDPIRSLTLLPGVSAISDFSTGFSVRGGGADQNLILLDESTIYNPSHVFGFFSVFNGDAIDDVKLYKGAIPARFGGRLSSVLDVRQREGNAREFEGTATVGLLASRLLLEGPFPGSRGRIWWPGGGPTRISFSGSPAIRTSTATSPTSTT